MACNQQYIHKLSLTVCVHQLQFIINLIIAKNVEHLPISAQQKTAITTVTTTLLWTHALQYIRCKSHWCPKSN